jgi:hypothetical protein
MKLNRVLLGIAGAFAAAITLSSACFAALPDSMPDQKQFPATTAPVTANPAAARTEVAEEMNLQCNTNHMQGATIDHLWIEGQFVLGTWSCGDLHGEYSFRMVGAKQLGQTYARTGDMTVSVRFHANELIKNVTLMDRTTADLLVDHQDGAH